MSEQTLTKPLVAGCVAIALQMYLKERDLTRSLYFGAAVAVGEYSAEFVTPIIKHINIPSLSRDLYDSKTLMERIVDVSLSAGMVYALNKYVLNNDQYILTRGELLNRIGVIVASDFVDYLNGKPLDYLTNE
jgi:hypothetical protein